MRRREFMALGSATVFWPLAARAQQPAMPVIGFLCSQSAAVYTGGATFNAFHQGLKEAGYIEGQNVAIEYRWADLQYDRLPGLAADLVSRRVTVIYATGSPAPALAAKATTSTIPIVFFNGSDPVKVGLVASLNRPGANVTGVTLSTAALGAKRLELLRELVPASTEIGVLVNPNDPDSVSELENVRIAAKSLGKQLYVVHATVEGEFEGAFENLTQHRIAALLVSTGILFGQNQRQLAALVARHSLAAMFDRRGFVDIGGLVSYGTRFAEVGRRAGIYVGRVLSGEKPADLPVEQPTKFELVINLKTAKALGLTAPQSLLARADEVIE
jgi:putative ABC transport system substrate-binding protein